MHLNQQTEQLADFALQICFGAWGNRFCAFSWLHREQQPSSRLRAPLQGRDSHTRSDKLPVTFFLTCASVPKVWALGRGNASQLVPKPLTNC